MVVFRIKSSYTDFWLLLRIAEKYWVREGPNNAGGPVPRSDRQGLGQGGAGKARGQGGGPGLGPGSTPRLKGSGAQVWKKRDRYWSPKERVPLPGCYQPGGQATCSRSKGFRATPQQRPRLRVFAVKT